MHRREIKAETENDIEKEEMDKREVNMDRIWYREGRDGQKGD